MPTNESLTSGDAFRCLLFLDDGPTWEESAWLATCSAARSLGFDGILMPEQWLSRVAGSTPGNFALSTLDEPMRQNMAHAVAGLAAVCADKGLGFYLDVRPDDALASSEWGSCLIQWVNSGVGGFRCMDLTRITASDWSRLINEVRGVLPECRFLAWTPGLNTEQVAALRGAGFDATFLSLPWWDYRSPWLAEEHARLSAVAPVFVPVLAGGTLESPGADKTGPYTPLSTMLWTAAVSGQGVLVSHSLLQAEGDAQSASANSWITVRKQTDEPLAILTTALSSYTALFRGGAGLALNPDRHSGACVDWSLLSARLPGGYSDVTPPPGAGECSLEPGGHLRFSARKTSLVTPASSSIAHKRKLGLGVMNAPRIAIEKTQPVIDGGRFAAKSLTSVPVQVQADIFMDGHEQLAACVAWRAADESSWREVPMTHEGNDRWSASFTPTRLGRHVFTIRAWHNQWQSYRAGVLKKREAGLDIQLDLQEGREVAGEAVRSARREAPELAGLLQGVLDADDTNALLSEQTAQAMARVDARPFETQADAEYPLAVERREAGFSSWYELFPRSQSPISGRYGGFADVRGRLASIRDMGFDVLYFPPIHPIGHKNRKGRNNSLKASPDDPGSPYAIGSEEGGHDAVHPQLGTLEDFTDLLHDARRHGLEIALDFAIQCSPDHPWLKEHHNWFDWRPDGSLRYAENPPKRYEDIVNPSFYHGSQPKPRASLWRALRDVVLFWIEQGVRIFRVDNPHTKPLPFWEWLLGEIHVRHPDVIFLSEAFTRPHMMYRLAKLGFSQSYTYFTWRNTKHELESYLEELNTWPVAGFFRPNFFVNTPDINPYFLQMSGRPGFLIRAALAATMAGSWGVYSGFELCESAPLPGREEYLDSEKYQLRQRDWNAPGNIIAEISQLNRIRKSTPALWSHLGLRFHPASDDKVLFFSKSTPEADSIVLVGISLDPLAERRAWVELPLWLWGLPDDATVQMEDACFETQFELHGKRHEIALTPQRPYFIWRVRSLV